MKPCIHCHEVKPLSKFPKHSMMADGHINSCQICTTRAAKERRHKDPEKAAAEAARNRLYRKTHKDADAKSHLKWMQRSENKRKVAAQQLANAKIPQSAAPLQCERCHEERRLERHHVDYSKPLLIEWLCRPCHYVADSERRAREATEPQTYQKRGHWHVYQDEDTRVYPAEFNKKRA